MQMYEMLSKKESTMSIPIDGGDGILLTYEDDGQIELREDDTQMTFENIVDFEKFFCGLSGARDILLTEVGHNNLRTEKQDE